MHWDVTSAEYVDGYRIQVRFRDGKSGIIDMKPLVDKGGVFSALRNIAAFKAFSIDPVWHVLSWENGRLDIAPETVYEEATGESTLASVAENQSPPYGSK